MVVFEGSNKKPRTPKWSRSQAKMLDEFCLMIRKLTIEWEQSGTTNEASGKLLCTISDHDDSNDDGDSDESNDDKISKKTLFITSFVQKSGERLTEICLGNDKVIRLPLSRPNWKIEYFTIKPLFEGQSLHIKNCSLEVELLNSQEDISTKSDTDARFLRIEREQISLSQSIDQINRVLFRR